MEFKQEDDGKKGIFTLNENENIVGEMTYTWDGTGKFIIDHTEVMPGNEGKGIGKKLVKHAVEFARNKDIKIIPLCPFAVAEFNKNSDYSDVKFQ